MDSSETFEVHLTVSCNLECIEKLMQWCAASQVKFVSIELERGNHPHQPMVTWQQFGSLGDVHIRIEHCTQSLAMQGWNVIRRKIECAANSTLAPCSDSPSVSDQGKYFEHHLKLLLPVDFPLAELTQLAIDHNSHLSKNARRVRSDGKCERFLTQRCRNVGRNKASIQLDALIESLKAKNYHIIEIEREYVLWDDHLELDAGWMTER